jgi:ribosomal protein L40E
MGQNREEASWAYRFGGVGVLFLVGGVCSLSIFFITTIGGTVSLIAGLLGIVMGLFLCGCAYRLLTSLRSQSTVEKEQPLSPQSSEPSPPTTQAEPMMSTMTCFRCAATIPAKAKFCPKCGTAVSRVASR